ncbi:MAG TPA: hypothetical protein HPP83_12220 [Candidatus Hydrogenedentes bacterium]|nr:hypothetical protein [Candidatus Hydrogenedentota bacterium]
MVNIILGAVAILFGLWLMFANWWATIDLLKTAFPLVLAVYGVIALLAGIKKFSRKAGEEE